MATPSPKLKRRGGAARCRWGAVIVVARTGSILAAAGNRTEADADPTAHDDILDPRGLTAARGEPRLPWIATFM